MNNRIAAVVASPADIAQCTATKRIFIMRHSFTGMLAMLLLLSTAAVQAQTLPRINFQLPSNNTRDVCIESGSLLDISSDNGDIILLADALAEDLSCPGVDPVINGFTVTPNPLDISSLNCDTDDDGTNDTTCLNVSWDVVPGLNATTCIIDQVIPTSKSSMLPSFFINPSAFVEPLNPTVFQPAVNDLIWPVNTGTNGATAGQKQFRMRCNSVGGTGDVIQTVNATFQDGSSPVVTINSFNIAQTSAAQGSTINFDWNVSFANNPSNPTCSLTATGVINTVTQSVSSGAGSNTATILASAPVGNRTFTFSCQPDVTTGTTDFSTDLVQITQSGGASCPPPPAGRDTRETTFVGQFDPPSGTWPGNNGMSRTVGVLRNQYKALEFNTSPGGNNFLAGEYGFGKSTSGLDPSEVTISECAGDFGDGGAFPPLGQFCKFDGTSGTLRWAFSESGVTDRCLLERNRTYFMNVRFPVCPVTQSQCFHLNTIQNIPLQ